MTGNGIFKTESDMSEEDVVPSEFGIRFSDYDVGKMIGKGYNAAVYEAKLKSGGKELMKSESKQRHSGGDLKTKRSGVPQCWTVKASHLRCLCHIMTPCHTHNREWQLVLTSTPMTAGIHTVNGSVLMMSSKCQKLEIFGIWPSVN
jgi:hypothetical protein